MAFLRAGAGWFRAHTWAARAHCAGLGVLLGSVAQGKSSDHLGGREGFCFPGQVPREPVKLL